MPRIAIVAALEREVRSLTQGCIPIERDHLGRRYIFFERDDMVVVCGGIGQQAARRAAEAVITLYHPTLVHSVGFAGALDITLHVGDVVTPAVIIDARDGSRTEVEGGEGILVTFMEVASPQQKASLAQAYAAQLVDMEAAAVAAAARAHGIPFSATKVISDELNFEMPEMSRFIDAQGRFRTAAFTLFAILRPWFWSRIAKLAANSSKAAAALGEHWKSLEYKLNELSEPTTLPADARKWRP